MFRVTHPPSHPGPPTPQKCECVKKCKMFQSGHTPKYSAWRWKTLLRSYRACMIDSIDYIVYRDRPDGPLLRFVTDVCDGDLPPHAGAGGERPIVRARSVTSGGTALPEGRSRTSSAPVLAAESVSSPLVARLGAVAVRGVTGPPTARWQRRGWQRARCARRHVHSALSRR